jgi:hypothetical protein
LLFLGLTPVGHEVSGKSPQTFFQNLPRIVEWKQNDGVADLLDNDPVALEAVLLGQAHGLALAVLKQFGGIHDTILEIYT